MGMSFRSIIIGLVASLLMGVGAGYVNKYVPGVHGLVRGHLPVSVFGLFIFFVGVVNPVLNRINKSLRFRPGEIAMILGMVLVACGITDAGLLRHFPRSLAMPMVENRTHPGWQKTKVLEETPPILLANGGKPSTNVVDSYVLGMSNPA
ncbi:MAG: hypothetical protein C0404_05075, partial [Verrucomicrobia bacterium]|nr:hypothetical protein [Verrucomicrobiota bacterium]